MRRKYKERIECLEEEVKCLHKKVKQLECKHSTTYFKSDGDYYFNGGIFPFYIEVCTICGKKLGDALPEEEMLKIKIERDKKRLVEIKTK